jgi:flavin-binding protein dodecin
MAVVKVLEILAESPEGWEAAAQEAVTEAAKTVRNIKSVYIKDFQAIVEGNAIVNYRVNTKVSFVVQE